MLSIGVVGAGIVGLSTATNLQLALPHARVTIIADQFGPDTVSYYCGGFYRPDLNHILDGGTDPEIIKQCLRDSWKYFSSLAMSEKAEETGIALVPGIVAHKQTMDFGYSLMKECCFDFHKIPLSELKRRGIPYEHAYGCTTVISQLSIFLNWLMREFKSRGGQIQQRTLKNLEELYGEFDIVANCCGGRAQTFLNDKECFPIRGQLAMLKAPWIKQFYYSDVDTYLIPHFDKLIVGGVRLAHNASTEVVQEVEESILRKAEAIFPELKGAERLPGWAGLRPGRTKLRLELEMINVGGNRKLPVIHNYGHGGHGVTLSWGTAVHVAKLVRRTLAALPKAAL